MKYTAAQKQSLIERYHAGESAATLCLQSGVPRSTFYSWLKPQRTTAVGYNQPTEITLSEFVKLKSHAARLEKMIEVLKTVQCTATSPTQEKLAALEKLHGQYSIHLICEALDVPRGTFYNHILRNKRENKSYQFRRAQLSEQIMQVYNESNQIFGSKKIRAVLCSRGVTVSDKMVAELMAEMHIGSIRSDSKRNYKRFNYEKKNDCLRLNFHAKAPNAVWVSDTTYFKFKGKAYYICAILDLYSRKVIAWKASIKHSSQLIATTFKQAYGNRKPADGLIFHSDRGVQFTAHAFQQLLKSCGVSQSFSPSGSPQHNAVMESFFSSLKWEELYRTNYRSVQEMKDCVAKYVEFYNMERPHATLGYRTPDAWEAMLSERGGSFK